MSIDGDGRQEVTLHDPLTTGDEVAAAIQSTVRALTPNNPANAVAYANFTATFDGSDSHYVLTSGQASATSLVEVTPAVRATAYFTD